jgi:hypothetical protein
MREGEVMKKNLVLGVLALVSVLFVGSSGAQELERIQQIIPLVSKCDDVKKVFSLSKCELPVTQVKLPSKEIDIRFSTPNDEWAVSNDTVANLRVIFRSLPSLFDYATEFSDYVIKHESDVPEILIYRNDKKGIRLTVQTGRGLHIDSIVLFPSQENSRRFKKSARRN